MQFWSVQIYNVPKSLTICYIKPCNFEVCTNLECSPKSCYFILEYPLQIVVPQSLAVFYINTCNTEVGANLECSLLSCYFTLQYFPLHFGGGPPTNRRSSKSCCLLQKHLQFWSRCKLGMFPIVLLFHTSVLSITLRRGASPPYK